MLPFNDTHVSTSTEVSPQNLYDYIIFDIETTGLSRTKNEIIQISALKYVNDILVDTFNSYVKPLVMPSDYIQFLTGISTETLLTAPNISDVMLSFNTFCDQFTLVGHNIEKFDIPFIVQYGFDKTNISFIDTIYLATNKLPFLENHKLPTLKKYFGFSNRSHNALNDCKTNALVFQNLRDDKLKSNEIKIKTSNILCDYRFCITGQFMEMDREEIIELIKNNGGRVTTSISNKTDYLILGKQVVSNLTDGIHSSKELKALKLISAGGHIKIIDLENLLAMIV